MHIRRSCLRKKSEVAIRQLMSIYNAQIIHIISHVILTDIDF